MIVAITGKIIVLSVIQRSKQNFLIALHKKKKEEKRKFYVMPKINWSFLELDCSRKEDLHFYQMLSKVTLY